MSAARPAHARWWPVELVAPKPAQVPWARAVEAAVAVGGAFGLGVLSGHTVDGLLASLGALPAVNGDRGGPWRVRAARVGGSGVAAAAGLLVGFGVRGDGWVVLAVVAACAGAAGLISSLNPVGSLIGLNLLVYAAISASDPLPGPAWRTASIALAGAAWGLLVKVPEHLGRRVTPERQAVAGVFRAVASLLAGADQPDRYERRWALTAALNQAEDALVAVRTGMGGAEGATVQLLLSLEEAGGLTRAAVDRLARRAPAAPRSVEVVAALGDLVAEGGAPTGPLVAPPDDDLVAPWEAAVRAITSQTRPPPRGEGRRGRRRRRRRRRASEILPRLTSRRSLQATGRLVLCIVVAEVCAVYLVHRHPYWVPLTVAVAMKPDFGSVFARAVQRALGTAAGVAVGGTILVVVGDVRELLPFFVVLAGLLPVTIARNYGMFVTCLTPLVLIQIDTLTPTPGQLVTARLLDTLLGVAIVLVLGYAIWPSTWRPRLLGDARQAVGAVTASLRETAATADPGSVSRRRSYRALSDVRTTFSQHFADPSPPGEQARVLWPLLVSLERILDESVHLAERPDPPPDLRDQLRAAADVLDSLVPAPEAPPPATANTANTKTANTPNTPNAPGASTHPAEVTAVLWDRVGEAVGAVDHLHGRARDRDRAGGPGWLSRLGPARR